MFRLHHAAMEGLEKRGVRRPLVRFERTKAPLLEECQTHSGVSARLLQRRSIHRENPRRAPAALHPSRTPRTVVPIASGCCGQRWTHRLFSSVKGLMNLPQQFAHTGGI